MNHVMIDLETLGTRADAVILSIGAVRFDLDSQAIDDNGFYASVSIESNMELGRKTDESTLLWWLRQPPEAQRVFHEPKDTLQTSLLEFSDWFSSAGVDDTTLVWSNGADFDIPMVVHAMHQCGLEAPWKFWNHRCFRTYKNLPFAKSVNVPRQGTHHNALDDALHQARLAQAITAASKAMRAAA